MRTERPKTETSLITQFVRKNSSKNETNKQKKIFNILAYTEKRASSFFCYFLNAGLVYKKFKPQLEIKKKTTV